MLGLLAAPSLWADFPPAVLEKLRAPAPEVEPAVLYTQSADINGGTGNAQWVVRSGTLLTEQGRDPWGSASGAFGPRAGAPTGAAITTSIDSPLLTGDEGTVMFCVQIPEVKGEPAIILSRGAYGDRTVFDLRADRDGNLILYTGGTDPKPQTLRLATYPVGQWMFVAMSWEKKSEGVELLTCTGKLEPGETLNQQSFSIAHAGEPSAPVLIAGRTNKDMPPALLEGGLFSALAIYTQRITAEHIQAVYTELLKALIK